MAIIERPHNRLSVMVERRYVLISFSLLKLRSPVATVVGWAGWLLYPHYTVSDNIAVSDVCLCTSFVCPLLLRIYECHEKITF